MESTVDGEMGPKMPFTLEVLPKAYPIYGNFEKKKHVLRETPLAKLNAVVKNGK